MIKTKLLLSNKLTYMFTGLKKKIQHSINKWKYEVRNEDIVELLNPIVSDYVDWYAERGLYLPETFASDPAAWTGILRKIQRAFDLAQTKEYRKNEVYKGEMEEGFHLFGKYFLELWK